MRKCNKIKTEALDSVLLNVKNCSKEKLTKKRKTLNSKKQKSLCKKYLNLEFFDKLNGKIIDYW